MVTSRIVAKKDIVVPANAETLQKELTAYKAKAIEEIQEFDFDTCVGAGGTYLINKILVPCEYMLIRQAQNRVLIAEELAYNFDTFIELCIEANKYTVFVPTINTFCSFCGISTSTLKSIANENNERGNIATMIIEKLGDGIMQNIISGKIHPIGGIFVAKANFGMRDNDAPQTAILNISNSTQSIDDIMREIKENSKF